jgi:hypothetical protein
MTAISDDPVEAETGPLFHEGAMTEFDNTS